MRTTLVAAALAAGCLLGIANAARAETAIAVGMCPGYRTALQAARGALARGDRTRAVADLQRAQAALRSCRREQARGTSLLAAIGFPRQLRG